MTACERLLARVIQANQKGLHQHALRLSSVGLNRMPSPAAEQSFRKERARAFLAERQWVEAERQCRFLLSRSSEANVHHWLVRSLFEQERHEDVVDAFEASSDEGSQLAASWQLYARSLSALGRHAAALDAARTAIELEPGAESDELPATRLLLQALALCGRHDEVVERARLALQRHPTNADLWLALGLSLTALGHEEAALEALRNAVALAPDSVEACCNLSFALLRRGQLDEGFRLNEHRQKNAGHCRRLGVAPWQGEPLEDKHLWIWSEQGFGDILQFARFVPLVRRRAHRTTFMVPQGLARLLRSNGDMGPLISHHPGFGAADQQCLVMSLPHHLGMQLEPDRLAVPYLFPEPDLVQTWRELLRPGPKIAVNWQGNAGYAGDRWRSMPFVQFEPLLASESSNFQFLSLQKGFGREQLTAAPFSHPVIDLADAIDEHGDAFVDSLAILSLVNLFITTDTALAHLAGAAGVRTWLLLGSAPDWRWGREGDRIIWYPTLRIFRHPPGGGWHDVIGQVRAALAAEPLHEPLSAAS